LAGGVADIPRPVLTAAHAAGGIAVGVVFDWGVALFPGLDPVGGRVDLLAAVVVPVVLILAALTARVMPLPAWAVAALGTALYGALRQVDFQPFGDLTVWLVAIAAAVGLALGGALLALGAESGPSRVAIAAGMAGGVMLPIVAGDMFRGMYAGKSGSEWAATMAYGLAVVLIVVAVLNGLAARVSARPALGIAAVAAAMIAAQSIATRIADATPPPVFGSRIGILPAATAVEVAIPLLATVAIGSGLAWPAYRRGGSDAVRWVAAGCAVAMPLPFVRSHLFTHFGLMSLAALAGLAVGIAVGRRPGPWEVPGPLLCAAGLLVDVRGYQTGLSYEVRDWLPDALLLAGAGLTLGVGLTRLARRTDTGAGDDVSAADGTAAGGARAMLACALPGFAAIVLIRPVLLPATWNADDVRPLDLGPPLFEVMCALVPVVLWRLARRTGVRTARESPVG
jgi:hypothetical protein